MKKIYTVIAGLMLTASVFAQAPEKMSYQAVVRDASNSLITNQAVGMQISILQTTATGTAVYVETQTPTTNANGLVSLEIGTGTVVSGDFTTIDWANDTYFIKTETDPTGGTSYTITGTSQLLSVAYALHAKTADNIVGGINEADPIFTSSQANNITGTDITNLSNLSNTNTGDQTLSEVLSLSNDAGTQIKNVSNPTDAQDAATKVYVDQMMQIMENNGLTVVDFTVSSTTTTVGANLTFTDNSAINPTSWAWDFGDGNTSTTQNPTHTYASAGTYTVSLTASNGTLTKTETKTNYITVTVAGTGTPGAGLTDTDGNTYTSIIIGGQEWMSENLKVTHYPNGDAIPLVTDNTAWANLADDNTSDAYSYYNNNASGEASTYGALYTYAAAIGDNWARDNTANQGVCPDGWHLPTDAEWTTLTDYLGTNAGSKLAGNEPLWTNGSLDQNADFGSSGFSALPSGYRHFSDGTFNNLGGNGYWWSAAESGSNANYRALGYGNSTVGNYNFYKSSGFSVRCVRD